MRRHLDHSHASRFLIALAAVVALACAVLLFLPARSAATGQASAANVYRAFQSPSKLIGCSSARGLGPTVLRCDTRYHTRFYARRRCAGEYGDSFAMAPTGAPRPLCISDTALDPCAPVLAYGTTRRFGPYMCASRSAGLTCTNAAGHGWFLSRGRQSLF